MKKEKGAGMATFLLSVAGKKHRKILDKAAENCGASQEKTLRAILKYAENTEWGKSHGFSEILKAKTEEELYSLWQKNVPLCDYEDIRNLVERHKNGEADILFPGKPKLYATTSGTTKEPKWIPITQEYYDNIYSKMTKVWLHSFIMNRPEAFYGKILSIVGKTIEGYAPDGTVYGSVSGLTRKDCPEFVKKLYTSPACVFEISDYRARYYTIMRMGIEQNVSLIVTANPSTIVEMQNNVNEFYDEYVKDIENGTLSDKIKVEENIRSELASCFKPNPKRARELRELKEKYGRVLPKHYWPDMQILNTWKCGNTHVYLDKFKDSFPESMLHMEFSYFSSECRTGLVLDDTVSTVMFPHMHYFEFVEEKNLEMENPPVVQFKDLEKGKRYSVFVTTFAGLYRYDMNDLLECTGKYKSVPTIRLVQKINGIVSITGEKLHETQFIDAVRSVEKKTGIELRFFIGFADLETSAYQFFLEFSDPSVTQEQADSFVEQVDAVLSEVNIEYKAKRESFRLKEPSAVMLQKDSFEKFKAKCIENGARDGQFKLNLLMQDDRRLAMFRNLKKE